MGLLDNLVDNATESFIDPFSTSYLLYMLVSINTLVDIHFRLLELGAANLNVSKARFFWYYFSSAYSYFIRTIFGMLILVLLVCLVTAIITAMFKLFSAEREVSKQMKENNISGAKAIMENVTGGFLETILAQMKKTANHIMNIYTVQSGNPFMTPFKIYNLPDVIKMFVIVLPIFMFSMMASYAISFYTPIVRPDEETKKSSVMSTNHHLVYFMFVMFIVTLLGIVIYSHLSK
jgi:hypothetical protein